MNKNYTNRELSELFDKIDTLLQRYFGKEDDYNFYEKDEEEVTSEYARMAYSDGSSIQAFRQNYFKKINDLKIDYSVYACHFSL